MLSPARGSAPRQLETAGRREEWGRRFTVAIESIQSPHLRSRVLGRTVLAELVSSELATEQERQLARVVLTEEATIDPGGSDLRLLGSGPQLDTTVFVEQTEPRTEDGET